MNEAYLKRTYGITLEEYEAIGEEQEWKCAACQRPLRHGKHAGFRAETDHDHKIKDRRKAVRGLLCGGRYAGCNRKLGRVDSLSWIRNILQYLADPPAQRVLRRIDGNK
jgi:hypothetical protein